MPWRVDYICQEPVFLPFRLLPPTHGSVREGNVFSLSVNRGGGQTWIGDPSPNPDLGPPNQDLGPPNQDLGPPNSDLGPPNWTWHQTQHPPHPPTDLAPDRYPPPQTWHQTGTPPPVLAPDLVPPTEQHGCYV